MVISPPQTSWLPSTRPSCRSPSSPWGSNHGSNVDRSILRYENALAKNWIHLLGICIRAKVPVILEAPSQSYIWKAETLQLLLQHKAATLTEVVLCAFGSNYKRPTKIAAWGVGGIGNLQCSCRPRGPCCFSGCHHCSNRSRTRLENAKRSRAADIPFKLRASLVELLIQAGDGLAARRMSQLYGLGP